ncbi:ATP-binding protein [Rufibacter quisquiliarum]|uniref:Histidine kinase-, DNA gyrase B-, and HSP90-like ATPase n=1 Tax=Rufibacter quisquiliarum TaxID=1549639 RepID=A0A839GMC0_9BACT|nr:ATP-binding protein [Rufibacter quisquiliarum]MBA9076077.1 hypothetical protein [Rufibacter quisquiliarum]
MAKEHRITVIAYNMNQWLKLIGDNRLLSRPVGALDKLVVDFSKAKFLQPCHLVSLACLIEEYYKAGVQIEFIEAVGDVHKYLCNIKFYHYWTPGFNRNRYTRGEINTALCLWQVDEEMIDTYSTEAKRYYEANYFNDKDLGNLSRPLQEVFNNIYDHAESPVSGYVLTQYYPNRDEIKLSVCDFGMGIPTKLNDTWKTEGKERLSDEDTLKAAFEAGVSSKSTPRNKGLGLFYLLSNVKELAGSLTLWSNNALLEYGNANGESVFRRNNNFFGGTLIDVVLKTDFLPDAEETEESEFIF